MVWVFRTLVLSSVVLRMVTPRMAALDEAMMVKSTPVMPRRTSLCVVAEPSASFSHSSRQGRELTCLVSGDGFWDGGDVWVLGDDVRRELSLWAGAGRSVIGFGLVCAVGGGVCNAELLALSQPEPRCPRQRQAFCARA